MFLTLVLHCSSHQHNYSPFAGEDSPQLCFWSKSMHEKPQPPLHVLHTFLSLSAHLFLIVPLSFFSSYSERGLMSVIFQCDGQRLKTHSFRLHPKLGWHVSGFIELASASPMLHLYAHFWLVGSWMEPDTAKIVMAGITYFELHTGSSETYHAIVPLSTVFTVNGPIVP